MRTRLATATIAVVVLVLAATGSATSASTTSTGSTSRQGVPAAATPGMSAAHAAPKPGVEVISNALNDGGGCVGIGYGPRAGQVVIPVYGDEAELCSATIRVRITGRQPVTLTQRVVAKGDGRLMHAVRVAAGGVGAVPGDRLPLTLLSTTAQPGETLVTGIAWRLPAGIHTAEGHMMHLVVSYRVSAGGSGPA